jgi:hypothetical protein
MAVFVQMKMIFGSGREEYGSVIRERISLIIGCNASVAFYYKEEPTVVTNAVKRLVKVTVMGSCISNMWIYISVFHFIKSFVLLYIFLHLLYNIA